MELDEVDRKILKLLQKDGRLAHAVIAKKVGLTGPSVLARVRRMEEVGVIRGYSVLLDHAALGQPLVAFIRVTLAGTPATKGENAFEAFVKREPAVLTCHSIDGEDSYMLHVRAASTDALQSLLNQLRAIRNVSRTVTSIALGCVKE